MPAPISNEKREIIVNLIKQGILSDEEIAAAVKVSLRSVKNIWQLYQKTGSWEPKPHRGGNPGWFLDSDYPLITKLVNENNDATLEELARLFEKETGDLPATTTLHNAIQRLGLTRKKKRKSRQSESGKT